MVALKQFLMPDVGEGLTEGEILSWKVQPGDRVTDGQIIVEIETAKAAVELPCPYDGVVAELLAEEGATVDVGAPIITVDTDSSEAPSDGPSDAPPDAPPEPARPEDALAEDLVPPAATAPPAEERQSVLVGYGPRASGVKRRARRTDRVPAAAAPAPAASPSRGPVLAKPPVRKLAKDRGIDLATVAGSGPNGAVTRADLDSAPAVASAPAPAATGREERIAVRGVRKHTAAAMVTSAFTAPHVTEFLTIDITPTMELRDRVAARREFRDVKLSPLVFVAKALLLAVRRWPMVNSTWVSGEDEAAGEIVVKHYVNLGIAAATERGLVVPNVKDADRLDLRGLAEAIAGLTETARAGRSTPADLAGGTISITNVGVFGIDAGTPILPPGETAILAFGAVNERPWVVDGAVVPRLVTTLALSFDHRIVDGELGSRFLADVGAVLADPGHALTL